MDFHPLVSSPERVFTSTTIYLDSKGTFTSFNETQSTIPQANIHEVVNAYLPHCICKYIAHASLLYGGGGCGCG
jgi:hypothetical protein